MPQKTKPELGTQEALAAMKELRAILPELSDKNRAKAEKEILDLAAAVREAVQYPHIALAIMRLQSRIEYFNRALSDVHKAQTGEPLPESYESSY